jgi:hypothetical protein
MRTIHTVVALSLLAGTLESAMALPRFASATGAKCQACHVNPTGGGMRQSFGLQYGREKLPVPEWSSGLELTDITTLVTNYLGFGADFRTLYFVRQQPDAAAANQFWQMEGNLYVNFRPANKVNIYLSKGLYSGFEIFGLLNVLPSNGHVKIGKFVPGFGLKLDDHTVYVRTMTGFSPTDGRTELTGVEAGIAPGRFTVLGGFYNSADGLGLASSYKAYLVRLQGAFPLSDEMGLAAGVNLFGGKNLFGKRALDVPLQTYYGGFASFRYGRFSVQGELDLLQAKTSTTVQSLVAYAECNYLVTQGVTLKAAYDFYDRDTDLKTGKNVRYSLGVDVFPLPGVEALPIYRLTRDDAVGKNMSEFNLVLHFFI